MTSVSSGVATAEICTRASRSGRSASTVARVGGSVREVAAVDSVHRLEVPRVPQEDVHRDDVAVAEPLLLQLLAQGVQRRRGLFLDRREGRVAA